GRGEVALRLAPLPDRIHDTTDQLADAPLALRRAERTAEVLRDDDVGRELRPALRHLDVALFEDRLARPARDHSPPDLPLDGVVRVRRLGDEAAPEPEPAPRRAATRPVSLVLGRRPLASHRLRRHGHPPVRLAPGRAPGRAQYVEVRTRIHHYILCCQGIF